MVAAGIVAGFILILISSFQTHLPSSAAQLPLDEVEALRLIGEKLGKKNWSFSVDPCNRTHGLITPGNDKFSNSTIDCDCTFPDNICHVVSIILKTQNLDGVLPAEIVRLPYLKQIDFTRNYLSGQIPAGWGSTKLVEIVVDYERLEEVLDVFPVGIEHPQPSLVDSEREVIRNVQNVICDARTIESRFSKILSIEKQSAVNEPTSEFLVYNEHTEHFDDPNVQDVIHSNESGDALAVFEGMYNVEDENELNIMKEVINVSSNMKSRICSSVHIENEGSENIVFGNQISSICI